MGEHRPATSRNYVGPYRIGSIGSSRSLPSSYCIVVRYATARHKYFSLRGIVPPDRSDLLIIITHHSSGRGKLIPGRV